MGQWRRLSRNLLKNDQHAANMIVSLIDLLPATIKVIVFLAIAIAELDRY